MLLEQATWSPAKNIQWTTDNKVVRHAVKVMEGGLMEAETGIDWQQRETGIDWQQRETRINWQQRETGIGWQQRETGIE
jgi:hypothetical protein